MEAQQEQLVLRLARTMQQQQQQQTRLPVKAKVPKTAVPKPGAPKEDEEVLVRAPSSCFVPACDRDPSIAWHCGNNIQRRRRTVTSGCDEQVNC